MSRPLVLIETLWNVKVEKLFYLARCFHRINRNIVECKDHTGSEQPPGETVLIETLWNVKGD